ncbi:rab proteins geranylgeranyltransferase component A 2-like [Hydra vulgaris]|uniref:Rab proteins geranylgeranyltransferase component A 2-like n=1 Tax=Hydra vulgaris TaxID=6087 RepID=A0ABM4CZY9_HYDVU
MYIFLFCKYNMTDNFPEQADVVVLGTGLCESMVAAALSRIGKKVVNIDRNSYYSSQWSTFSFNALQQWASFHQSNHSNHKIIEGSMKIPLFEENVISNIFIHSCIPEKNAEYFETNFEEKTGQKENNINKSVEEMVNISQEVYIETKLDKVHNPVHNHNPNTSSKNSDNPMINSYNNANQMHLDATILSNLDDTIPINFEKKIQSNSDNSNPLSLDNTVSNNSDNTNPTKLDNPILINSDISPINVNFVNNKKSEKSILCQAKVLKGDGVTVEDFQMLSHKFNLDICFKLLYSNGPLVNTIIKANISHYIDFTVVNRIVMFMDGAVVEVPCNRSDVFTSPILGVIEKRHLMKFLTYCFECALEESELSEELDLPFVEFLKAKQLSESLQKFIIYSIAMVKPEIKALHAVKEIKYFLMSLGKYGKSPFIWPLYGIGELPQAFSRMSAVFGGVYCLNKNAEEICIDFESNKCTGLIIDNKIIRCEHIVMEKSYLPSYFKSSPKAESISRAILITNKSLLSSVEECLTFMTIPPVNGKINLVRVLELGPASSACPAGLFILYLICNQDQTAKEDLEVYTKLLTEGCTSCLADVANNGKPRLLWSLYFNQNSDCFYENLPENLFVGSMPGTSLGFQAAVKEAEIIFKSIAPNENFMIPVPNPEDILWTDYDDATIKEDGIVNMEA